MDITRKLFGILSSGKEVFLHTMQAGDLSVSVSSLGAALTALYAPGSQGRTDDVLLGYSTLDSWTHNRTFMGVVAGRFANRIAQGRFSLGGKTYQLRCNDGENSLHSGPGGFDRKVWAAESYRDKDGIFLRLELHSPDGEGGFPGAMIVVVTYGLFQSNKLSITYEARSDALCPVNLTNHAYFNLEGEGEGSILQHELLLNASSYLELDGGKIPTGKLLPVAGTPFDFRERKRIGKDIEKVGGYDHCFAVDGSAGELRPCAQVFAPKSGRIMDVFTTHPGVQFYTGNFLDGIEGKLDSVYSQYSGFCLETQHFPDSPNKPSFPAALAGPEKVYREEALFAFDVGSKR
ncbi:MAG: galactose mutarotase [Spirochaetaceae bacterium]|jgi:aldose 1-epimerase|nr:galactose mutarotase [Spirochaetaceae bacterium]